MEELEALNQELRKAEPRMRVMMFSALDKNTQEKLNTLAGIKIVQETHDIYLKTASSRYPKSLQKLHLDKINQLKEKLKSLL